MKSLSITLLVAFFCVTVSGVNPVNTEVNKSSKETNISKKVNVEYSFEVNRHVRPGEKIPSNG